MKLSPATADILEAIRPDPQPIPDPVTPLHYTAPPKYKWAVDCYWRKLTNGTYTRQAGWIRYGKYSTESQARQAAADILKTKSAILEKCCIRNTKTGEVIEL
jgi:hypothetical protein